MQRRDFLSTSAGLVVGAGLSSTVGAAENPRPALGSATEGKHAVGIARGSNMEDAVRKAVELSGGMDFIKEGQTVLIKPNCTGAKKNPTTTHPEVLYAVIKMVNERGPRRILVSDRCFSPLMMTNPEKALTAPKTVDVMRAVGHLDAVKQAQSECKAPVVAVGLEDAASEFENLGKPRNTPAWRKIKPENAKHWPNGYELAELLFSVDHVVSVPVIKTHFQAWFTMSMKAFVGMSHHRTRREFHQSFGGSNDLFNQKASGRTRRRRGMRNRTPETEEDQVYGFVARIAELNLGLKPALNILDGTESFVYGGPSSGDSVEPKLVVASRDRIAADAVGIAVLRHFGTETRLQFRSPWQTPFIKHGIKIGLGIDGPDKLDLKAHDIHELDSIKHMLA